MANFILEITSEEIPSRFQSMAMEQLHEKLSKSLEAVNIRYKSLQTYVGPRRLTAYIQGLDNRQPDISTTIKGPRVDAPQQALDGFLRSQKTTIDACRQQEYTKGTFWVLDTFQKGVSLDNLLPSIICDLLDNFSWPKSMYWNDKQYRWVRPLRRILALLDGKIIPLNWGGVTSSNLTQGHSILHPNLFEVSDWQSYEQGLKKRQVMLDVGDKLQAIHDGIDFISTQYGYKPRCGNHLYKEVAGLVEYPWFLVGTFDKKYLDLPVEVLETTLRHHQRYFLLEKNGKPTNTFIVVTNMPTDNKKCLDVIRQGNENVLHARLEDASFYWHMDRKTNLKNFLPKLQERLFHKALGTLWNKKERLQNIISAKEFDSFMEISSISLAQRQEAAELCKADLCTGVVAEFPELQGIMGGYYALSNGYSPAVAQAIKDQYKPQGPEEACPTEPLSVVLSICDKIDTLVGFFAIDQEPTGSKDPFALRRTALGLIRLVLSCNLDMNLKSLIDKFYKLYAEQGFVLASNNQICTEKCIEFLYDRLKIYLRDQNYNHKLVAASVEHNKDGNIASIVDSMQNLKLFLETELGETTLNSYKRTNNILKSNKKLIPNHTNIIKEKLSNRADIQLLEAIKNATATIQQAAHIEQKLQAVSSLNQSIDIFFDAILVTDEDEDKRSNRLIMLGKIQNLFNGIVNFNTLIS